MLSTVCSVLFKWKRFIQIRAACYASFLAPKKRGTRESMGARVAIILVGLVAERYQSNRGFLWTYFEGFSRESVRHSSSESGFISFVVSGFTSSPF